MSPSIPAPDDAVREGAQQGFDPDAPTQMLSYHSALSKQVSPARVEDPKGEMSWNARYRILRKLGSGAQGVVYLALREGVDGYSTKVAIKLYARDKSVSESAHVTEMQRIA
ncbi:MAG: hypothetical protein VYB34_10875, partial [Planctomycetota bacterium]|nr:hypothetical protein [Planctomycetota bacterium]